MRLLLDTHVAVWTLLSPTSLTRSGRDLIADPDNDIYVSAVSIWEIAIKNALGRAGAPALSAGQAVDEFAISGFIALPITAAHAVATQTLPLLHHDPFDRLLVAQALTEPMKLLTHDASLLPYGDLIIGV